jgi:hypothetical protein
MLRGERGFVFTLCMGKKLCGSPKLIQAGHFIICPTERTTRSNFGIVYFALMLDWGVHLHDMFKPKTDAKVSAGYHFFKGVCCRLGEGSPGRLQTAWAAWHCVFGWYIQRWHMLTPQSKMIQWASEAATNEAWLIHSEMCFQLLHLHMWFRHLQRNDLPIGSIAVETGHKKWRTVGWAKMMDFMAQRQGAWVDWVATPFHWLVSLRIL